MTPSASTDNTDANTEHRRQNKETPPSRANNVGAWRAHVDAMLNRNATKEPTRRQQKSAKRQAHPQSAPQGARRGRRSNVSNTNVSRCAAGLRVAFWRRGASRFGARSLVNLGQIARLVAQYSAYPMRLLSADSRTPFLQQLANFRSFDVLISPHGSQRLRRRGL